MDAMVYFWVIKHRRVRGGPEARRGDAAEGRCILLCPRCPGFAHAEHACSRFGPQIQNRGAGGGRFEKEFLAGMAEMEFVLHNSQCS